jgi:CBS domain-containing protein
MRLRRLRCVQMSERLAETDEGSYLTPRLEHAFVGDAMRHGILSCFPDASLRAAARTMALHHIHTVVVNDPDDGGMVGVVTDSGLVDAMLGGDEQRPVGEIVDRNVVRVSSEQRLAEAAAKMREHGVDHAIVLNAHNGRPAGMLSTLDILGVAAWGEA